MVIEQAVFIDDSAKIGVMSAIRLLMKNFSLNALKLVDRIVIGAVLIFIVVVALLIVTFVRQSELRQAVSIGSVELRENVEELQSTTEELREQVDQLRAEAPLNNAAPEELAAIDQQLSELDEKLDTMEQTLEEIVPILEEEVAIPASTALPDPEAVEAIQGEIHGLFTAAAWLIGATSVVTAILAFVVLNPRSRERRRRATFYQPEEMSLTQHDPDNL